MLRFAIPVFMLCLPALSCGPAQKPAPAKPATPAPAAPATSGQTAAAPGAPESGDWLITRLPVEMKHLNPITSSDAYANFVMTHIFERLLDRNPDTLEVEPWIAEKWEVSDDKLQYTFHLRKDAVFSDGTPLTAHDCKFTYDIMMNPTTDDAFLRNYFQDVTACEVLDDHTVRYVCAKPYFLHLIQLGDLDILPRHVYSKGEFNKDFARTPVGSGPYMFDAWKTNQEVVLVRNPRYWNNAKRPATFDKRIFRFITDNVAAFQVLLRGEVDSMTLLPEQWTKQTDTPRFVERFNKTAFSAPQFYYLGWNARRPQFADKRVRRALTMLLDRDTVLKRIFNDLGAITVTGFSPELPEFNPDVKPLPFDPKAAVQMLDEAGWKDGDGDGIRDKDGVPFRFEMSSVENNPIAERTLTLHQEELKRAGIEMTIRTSDWASMMDRVHKREFDAMYNGWSETPDPDPYQIWHSSQAQDGSNYVNFVNAEADALLDKNRLEFDRKERVKLMWRFQEILNDEQPYTFLIAPQSLQVVDKRIQGARFVPMIPMRPRWEWYVPKNQQRYH